MATFRRPRPSGGRHPPPLAPTVNTFKPRAEWSNAGSSMFLYLNLPGFYRDQIQIKRDENGRTIQIEGQRPLSTQTRARFNEYYRVPEFCDMSRIKTSFLHGLLTIEMPIIVEDRGKPTRKEVDDGALGLKKPPQDEKRVSASSVKDEREVEEKVKEERGRAPVTDGSLELKKREKQVEQMSGQKVKEEEGRMEAARGVGRQEKENVSVHGGMSEQKMRQREEVVGGGFGSKQPKEEEKLIEEIKGTGKGDSSGKDRAEETREEIANAKPRLEKVEAKVAELVKPDDLKESTTKNIRKPVAEGEDNAEKTTERGTESHEIVQGSAASLVAKDQREINGGSSYADDDDDDVRKKLLQRMGEEEIQTHGYSLVNVGVAALVIMGFGAYLSLPLFKLFN